MRQSLTTVVLCLAAVAVIGNLGVLAMHINHMMQEKEQRDGDDDRVKARSFLGQKGGHKVVELDAELAEKYGVETAPARAYSWQERVVVYGRVVPNPRATYEVRAPFAGTLRAGDKEAWPTVGETLRPGQALGRLLIRIGPQERLDLANRLAEARLKRKGAEQIRTLRQNIVDRLVKAEQTSVVAQRVLDDAQVQLADAKTQLATAQAAEDLLQKAADDIKHMREATGLWDWPLLVPSDKSVSADLEVTELAGQPEMAVEAGGLIVRLVDFSRPLVRLDVPSGLLQDGLPPEDIALSAAPLAGAMGDPSATVKATRVGPASRVDAASQFAGWFYAISAGKETGLARMVWRPGFFIQARWPRAVGETRQAVAVPATAILYHQGRALVYIRKVGHSLRERDVPLAERAAYVYEKREVQVLGHDGDRCILAAHSPLAATGISPGEVVVTRQAQVLLSTEFRDDADDK